MSLRLKIFLNFIAVLCCLAVSGMAQAQTSSKHLGLKTVVIDPGHGGKDPGALGKGSTVHEKHIVLSVAKKFGDKIKAAYPDVKVIYTRSNDTFIGLHERAMVARRNNADLFISIHCNGSSNSEAKGSSVHILGQNSNNKKNKTDYFERNMSTAQRENSVIVLEDDYKTKYQEFDPNSPESYIGHQLQWMAYYESSLLFASEVVDNLIKAPLVPRRLVVDQDIFQVLVEANMPAVLLELAFISNPNEYKYLSSKTGQEEIAERLFQAFKSYKNMYDMSLNVEAAQVQVEIPHTDKVVEEPTSFYTVQIMSLAKLLQPDDPRFKGLKAESYRPEGTSTYKYIVGKFNTREEATAELKKVKEKFPQAFIIYVDNK